MAFKKMRGCKLSYDKQGYIYFLCKNYAAQPEEVKKKIRTLCDEVAGEYSAALFSVLTTGKSVRKVAIEHYISEPQLYRLRLQFYQSWNERKK